MSRLLWACSLVPYSTALFCPGLEGGTEVEYTERQKQAITAISMAICEAVAEMPDGLPAGPLYAALMTTGITLEQFEIIMDTLVSIGKVRKSGHQYFPCTLKESEVGQKPKL